MYNLIFVCLVAMAIVTIKSIKRYKPITFKIVAVDICSLFFVVLQRKYGLTFHVNHMIGIHMKRQALFSLTTSIRASKMDTLHKPQQNV